LLSWCIARKAAEIPCSEGVTDEKSDGAAISSPFKTKSTSRRLHRARIKRHSRSGKRWTQKERSELGFAEKPIALTATHIEAVETELANGNGTGTGEKLRRHHLSIQDQINNAD
jgi:hypothetical protein